jgi:Glycosyltransferase family 87
MRWLRRLDAFDGGLPADVLLYALSAGFALFTAATSTLAPHRAWGAVAVFGYAVAAVLAVGQWTLFPWRGPLARAAVAIAAFTATALLPLLIQAVQRAGGRTDRAQEEVLVVEDAARRLLDTGTPYLGRSALAALAEPLFGYMPYQPGMAGFGLPRAWFGFAWWTDARVWFAIVFVGALALALHLLFYSGSPGTALVRAGQAATVLPICALTLATGGDDMPVLGLCLLGFALAATGRWGWAGVAVGAAAALKLFAWPVLVVLLVAALVARRGRAFTTFAVGVPVVTALPSLLVDPEAFTENVLAFPLGRGLVTSPAASPLPGHLLATGVPGGRIVVLLLLAAAAAGLALFLVRRPPHAVADAALISGIGLLAAMLLLPATRFGYLLYPVALLVWVPALRGCPMWRPPISDLVC